VPADEEIGSRVKVAAEDNPLLEPLLDSEHHLHDDFARAEHEIGSLLPLGGLEKK
jgi:hypothetical protein